MQFNNEAELQEFIHSYVGGQREVTFSDGSRIDVLTEDYAIEVKPKLTRNALLLALGQSTIYRTNCPDKIHVVAGLTPKNEEESYSNADRVRKAGTEVWYIDHMPEFITHWDDLYGAPMEDYQPFGSYDFGGEASLPDIPALAVAIVICLFGAVFCSQQPAAVNQSAANVTPVFSRPIPGATVIDRIPSQSTVRIKQCSGAFVQVEYEGRTGWVRDFEFNGPVCR